MRAVPMMSLLLVLSACGSSSGVDAGNADAPALDAPSPIDGAMGTDAGVATPAVPYYEVPTTDGALAPHVFFAVPDVHYVVTGTTVVLTYDFPPDLSGVVDQPLEFTGPVDAAGNATISGASGSGTCTATGNIVRCTEHFGAGLLLDTASATSMTSSYSSDPAARAARAAVIDLFASDPIGIVVFDRVVAGEPSGGGG